MFNKDTKSNEMEKGYSFQEAVLEQLDILMQNRELWSIPHTILKSNLTWFRYVNVKPETIKPGKSTGVNFHDLGFGKDFKWWH